MLCRPRTNHRRRHPTTWWWWYITNSWILYWLGMLPFNIHHQIRQLRPLPKWILYCTVSVHLCVSWWSEMYHSTTTTTTITIPLRRHWQNVYNMYNMYWHHRPMVRRHWMLIDSIYYIIYKSVWYHNYNRVMIYTNKNEPIRVLINKLYKHNIKNRNQHGPLHNDWRHRTTRPNPQVPSSWIRPRRQSPTQQ